MYLIHLLQSKGYPVTQVFETQVKHINTLRFNEFLEQRESEARAEEEANAKIDFSFHPDDSFALMVTGPQLRPLKPEIVPMLNLDGLPEYVTSSSSESGEHDYGEIDATGETYSQRNTLRKETAAQISKGNTIEADKHCYQESMKYIEDFYRKQQEAVAANNHQV